jgi:signal transduction histidine kinase/DNA-binding transcriptional ArsR family regulator
MRITISIFLLLLIAGSIQADSYSDSLRKELKLVKSPEQKLDILHLLIRKHWTSNPDKTENYLSEAIKIAEKTENPDFMGRAYVITAFFYEDIGKPDKAVMYHLDALEIAVKMDENERIAGQYNNLGIIFKNMGNTEKALEYYTKAYEITKSDTVRKNYLSSLINIAILLYNNHQYDEALKSFDEAFTITKEYNLPIKEALVYANISSVFIEKELPDSAVYYAKKAYRLSDSLVNIIKHEPGQYSDDLNQTLDEAKIEKYRLSLALVSAYVKKRQFKEAEKLLKENLEFFESTGNILKLSSSYKELYELYRESGDTARMAEALRKTIEYSEKSGNQLNLNRAYSDYYLYLKKQGKIDSALAVFEKYSKFKDSLNNKNLSNAIAEQRVLYGLQHAENENVKLRNEKLEEELARRNAQNLNNILLLVTLFLLMVIFVFIFLYRKIKSLNNNLVELNATKDKFFTIIAHDLKNPINAFHQMSLLLNKDYGNFTESERKESISALHQSSKNVSGLLENLLIWSKTQRGKIEPNITEVVPQLLLKNIAEELKILSEPKNIELTYSAPDDIKLETDPNLLKVIITNIAINAIKFTPEGGKVEITSSRFGNSTIFEIKDNGIGISPEKKASLFRVDNANSSYGTNGEKGTGLGLIIVKEFVDLLGGKIEVESEEGKGTIFRIVLR